MCHIFYNRVPFLLFVSQKEKGDKVGVVRALTKRKTKGVARSISCGERVKPEASSYRQHSTAPWKENREEVKEGKECCLSLISAFDPTLRSVGEQSPLLQQGKEDGEDPGARKGPECSMGSWIHSIFTEFIFHFDFYYVYVSMGMFMQMLSKGQRRQHSFS